MDRDEEKKTVVNVTNTTNFNGVDIKTLLDTVNKIAADVLILKSQGAQIMATLDEVLSATTDESTKLDSLSTFIAGLKQQIADALAGVTLPPAVQAKVDQVFSNVQSNTAKVQTALDANVTPAP